MAAVGVYSLAQRTSLLPAFGPNGFSFFSWGLLAPLGAGGGIAALGCRAPCCTHGRGDTSPPQPPLPPRLLPPLSWEEPGGRGGSGSRSNKNHKSKIIVQKLHKQKKGTDKFTKTHNVSKHKDSKLKSEERHRRTERERGSETWIRPGPTVDRKDPIYLVTFYQERD